MQKLIDKHDLLWQDPSRAKPLVLFQWAVNEKYDMSDIVADPKQNLGYDLFAWGQKGDLQDDSIPMVRPQFGTGLIASAFGAEIILKENGMPAVSTKHALSRDDIDNITLPDHKQSGLVGNAWEILDYFIKNKPPQFSISQFDLQGPWNTTQLLLGTDSFLAIKDCPDKLCRLMDKVTDVMIRVAIENKKRINESSDHAFLLHTKVKGGSRIANCSTDMISPDDYQKYVMPCDQKFYDALGGGMMHICGNQPHCVPLFNRIPNLYGLEFNFNYIDLFKISELLREDIVLICTGPIEFPLVTELGLKALDSICKGELPDKRNILFRFNNPESSEKAKRIYQQIKNGIERKYN